MIRIRIILCVMFVAGLFLAGCEPSPLPPIQLETTGLKPLADYADLAEVMKCLIDKKGYAEPLRMDDVEKKLHAQLKLLAITGPDATEKLLPTKASRLAYWYNARAAWSIRLAMDLHNAGRKNAIGLTSRGFPLNGCEMTLSRIDAELDSLAGLQAVVASPSMDLHRAIMPRQPFEPKTIEKEIARRFNEYISSRGRFIIDVEMRQIQFTPVFWRYRRAILAEHVRQFGSPDPTLTTALLPMVKGLARYRLQGAIGYRCVENPKPGKLTVDNDD